MNDKIVEFISNIDSTSFDEFISNVQVESELSLNTKICSCDFSWLDEVEEKLPFIVNIVNLDYTNTNNKVVLKSYENRFIKTTLYRLYDFLLTEKEKVKKIDLKSKNKALKSKISTLVNNENIDIELNIKSTPISNGNEGEAFGLTLIERIDRVFDITKGLINSDFIKGLEDVSLIQEDVTKTEAISQELNYKKVFELYEYINDCIKNEEYKDINNIKKCVDDKLLITSFLEYQVLNNCLKDENRNNIYKALLEKIIEKLINDTNIDEKSFKKMINKKFEDEYDKKKNREKNIQNIFIKSQDNYNKQVKDALRALKN